MLLKLPHNILWTLLCMLSYITGAIQLTESCKYLPWGPHVGQPCSQV